VSGDFHRGDLERLQNAGRYRSLTPRTGIDFASNDYLGLANDQRLRDAVAAALDRGLAVGSGGSRLLRGNDPEIATLEAEAAAMFRTEAALFFSTGFAANVALLATLPRRHTVDRGREPLFDGWRSRPNCRARRGGGTA